MQETPSTSPMPLSAPASARVPPASYEDVAVLIPCYNEATTIGAVVDSFHESLPGAEVWVYDNNSSDDTAAIAQAHGAHVRHEPRQGKGSVVRQMHRDIDASYYLMVDGDGTYPADAAPQLLEPLFAQRADHVVGDRLSNGSYGSENSRFGHLFGNKLVRWLIRVLYGYSFSDVMSGYRAYTRPFAKTFPCLSPGFELETEMSIFCVDHRWRLEQVPVRYQERSAGSTSKLDTVKDGIRVLGMIAQLAKDWKPLPFFGFISLLLLVACLALGLPVIAEFRATGLVERFPTAILALGLGLLSVMAITAGIVLDSEANASRRMWELQATREFGRSRRAD